jgi:hypothetical protein
VVVGAGLTIALLVWWLWRKLYRGVSRMLAT